MRKVPSPNSLGALKVTLLVQYFRDTEFILHKLTNYNSEQNLYFEARTRRV